MTGSSVPRPSGRITRTHADTIRAYLACGSVKAAAERLGVPEATVRSRLHAARRRSGLPTLAHLAYWIDRPMVGASAVNPGGAGPGGATNHGSHDGPAKGPERSAGWRA